MHSVIHTTAKHHHVYYSMAEIVSKLDIKFKHHIFIFGWTIPLKDQFTSRWNISWKFTHPHVIQYGRVFLSSVKKKLRFWGKYSRIFLHIVDFNGSQQVEGPNCSFNATSKGCKPLYMKKYFKYIWSIYLAFSSVNNNSKLKIYYLYF